MGPVVVGFVRVLSSFGLTCVLLVLLALLTWRGTLAQVDGGLLEAQRAYFHSFFLIERFGPVPIPLPGASLVLCVLAFNLFAGGIARLRKGWATAGVLVAHVGIGLLLVAAFVKAYYASEGRLTLFEGERSNAYRVPYRWELSIARALGGGAVRELLVPAEDLADAAGPRPLTLTADELPFDLELAGFLPSCRVLPRESAPPAAGPAVDGFVLVPEPRAAAAEHDVAGAYATAILADGSRRRGILWALAEAPWTVSVDGVDWTVDLRHERHPLPFTVALERFTRELHPRTRLESELASEVTLHEGSTARAARIAPNEPLRERGLVLYQSSWGPEDARAGDALFATLSVVRDPAERLPLVACVVVAGGLLLHFGRKLARYVRAEAGR